MPLDNWIAFATVVTIFAIIPGPTVILVIGQVIVNGKRAIFPLASGVVFGDFVAMSLSLLGLGAVLAASATMFAVLKWFGVGYLIYLGISSWRAKPSGAEEISRSAKSRSLKFLFKSSFLVTALNPKDIVFFVAFLPQFVDTSLPVVPQFALLMLTFLGIISLTITSFAFCADAMRNRVSSVKARTRLNKIGGGALVGAGIFASTVERN